MNAMRTEPYNSPAGTAGSAPGRPPTRLVVIGLDSGDPDLIRTWAAAGELVTFRRLIETTAHGRVINPLGLEAGSAWPTFYNGLDPAKHGQYDGTRRFDPASYSDVKYSRDMLYQAPIWKVLGDAGRRIALVDAPYRYLSGEFDGIEVHDWGTHAPTGSNSFAAFATHPPELADELTQRFGSDPLGGAMCDAHRPRSLSEQREFRDRLVKRAEAKGAMAEYLLRRGDWDFFLATFSECHCIGHHAWHVHDASHPEHDAAMARELGDPVLDVYKAVDRAVGRLLERIPDDHTVVVYCSHGMGSRFSGTHFLDRVLMRLEGLQSRDTPNPLTGMMRSAWRSLPSPVRLALKPAQAKAYKKIYHDNFGGNRARRRFFEILANDRTAGIRINLAGREDQGVVQPGEDYDATCRDLERKLLRIVNSDTGVPLVREVHRTADCHRGSRQNDLPDLLVTWNGVGRLTRIESPDIGIMQHVELSYRTGDHKPEGMFYAYGPEVHRKGEISPVDVVDFAPTFAQLLDAEMPETDGKPIDVFFEPASTSAERSAIDHHARA